MRKSLQLLTLLGIAPLLSWTPLYAQGLDGLPKGFPTADLEYLGDNQFQSPSFGYFQLDTSIKNRVIHTVLGPMIWDWDESNEVITLHTEWWGDLYTQLPTVPAANNVLGFRWPYLQSEITGAVYYVNVSADSSDPESTPFYNHRLVDGEPIAWQHSIGVDLSSAANYYKAAETIVGQMQSVLAQMALLQEEFVNLPVSVEGGEEAISEKFDQVEEQFLTMHKIYVKFVFYYHRCTLAPVWSEREGKPDEVITLADAYVRELPGLKTIAEETYGNGQEILYINCVSLVTQKMNQLKQLVGG